LNDKEKEIVQIILSDKEKENYKSLFNAMLGLKLILESGNIGTINVIYEGDNKILIIYRDKQNASINKNKRIEDL